MGEHRPDHARDRRDGFQHDRAMAAVRESAISDGIASEMIDGPFAGSIAGQVLSSGIDSRLNKVLRAEKGLTYGAGGGFSSSTTPKGRVKRS